MAMGKFQQSDSDSIAVRHSCPAARNMNGGGVATIIINNTGMRDFIDALSKNIYKKPDLQNQKKMEVY